MTSRLRPAPSNLFVVDPSTTPTRAIRFDHPTKTWSFDPLTVEATLLEAFDEAEDRISNVERERADAVADLLGRSRPSNSSASSCAAHRSRRPVRRIQALLKHRRASLAVTSLASGER